MSPNNKAYVAVTIHFEQNGVPISFLLDIVEVAWSHSSLNLAAAFSSILDDFRIADKVGNKFKMTDLNKLIKKCPDTLCNM